MSLFDRPSVAELLEAVREYLHTEVAPVAADRRARFRALIAANVLAICERELAATQDLNHRESERLRALDVSGGTDDERRAELARRIRAGDYDAGPARSAAIAYAKEAVAAKLAVSNPKYLEQYR